MRLGIRALVIAAMPMVAFGWLSSAQLLPALPPRPPDSVTFFVASGVLLVVGSSALVVLGDVIAALRSPGPMPTHATALWTLALASPVAFGAFVIEGRDAEGQLHVARQAGLAALAMFVALLAAITLVRALLGQWSAPDLPLRSPRRSVLIALLAAMFAAAPVYPNAASAGGYALIPMIERVRMEVAGTHGYPRWTYSDSLFL